MTDRYFKTLGVAHGVYGAFQLLGIPLGFVAGVFTDLSATHAAIMLMAAAVGGLLSLYCAWLAWRLSPRAHLYAWGALIAYIVSVLGDTVFLLGLDGIGAIMPMFYGVVFVRAAAATGLTVLGRSIARRQAANNSFKPNPLRGSA